MLLPDVPTYVSVLFILTTFLTVYLFYKASNNSETTIVILSIWLLIQGLIALSGFYTVTTIIPPRFLLLVLPPLLTMVFCFATNKGLKYIDSFYIERLTLLHIIRIPVEVVLYYLFLNKAVPVSMTFEGTNFDILSGLSAPFIYYFGFVKKKLNNVIILIWNVVCIVLLANIVVTAILSSPSPFQKLSFDQPNIAILYFPYVWLPCCIVPIVLFSHLVAIRKMTFNKIL